MIIQNQVVLQYIALVSLSLSSIRNNVHAFQPIHLQTNRNLASKFASIHTNTRYFAKPKDNGEDDDADDRAGMNSAFQSLDELASIDLGLGMDDKSSPQTSTPIKADLSELAAATAAAAASSSPEDEVKLYSERINSVSNDEDAGIYDDIMSDMGGSGTSATASSSPSSSSSSVINDADGIGSAFDDKEQLTAVELSQDTDEFMKRALSEAMDEVKNNKSIADVVTGIDKASSSSQKKDDDDDDTLADSILNDAEMMAEINAVFDKANEKLLANIAEIKEDQIAMSQASADSRTDALAAEKMRLAEAEGSVVRLVDKVKSETMEVEKAMADLQEAKRQMEADPLNTAADLKAGGLVKQGAFVGALLFSFRTFGEVLQMSGPYGDSHVVAALVQGVIALACAAYFIFV